MLDTTYYFQRTPGSRQSEVEGGNSVKEKEIQKVRKGYYSERGKQGGILRWDCLKVRERGKIEGCER